MPFAEHLRDLRVRLRNSCIALAIACVVCFYFAEDIYHLLALPYAKAYRLVHGNDATAGFVFTSMIEPFWVYFKLALHAGIFAASPVIFYQLWKFVAPGLYDKEKRIAIPFTACSAGMFIGGAAFCYFFVFPAAFKFFLSYAKSRGDIVIRDMQQMQNYLDLATTMLLGFGLVFELPLLIFFLSYAGIVTHRSLWKFNKYWIVLSFIIGGVLTPGPDVMSQFLMASPLVILYQMSIGIAYLVTRRRERAAAASEPAPPDDLTAAE